MQGILAARRRNDHEHGLPGFDQRNRAVLQLTRREPLRVDVGELFELERPLEGDRVPGVTAEEQHRAGVRHPASELLDRLVLLEHGLELLGKRLQLAEQVGDLGIRNAPSQRGEVQPEQVESGDLSHERLGRRDRDLGSGMRVDDGIRLARNGGALRVADRERARASLDGVLHCHERVHRLARLADRHDQSRRGEDGVAVAELV